MSSSERMGPDSGRAVFEILANAYFGGCCVMCLDDVWMAQLYFSKWHWHEVISVDCPSGLPLMGWVLVKVAEISTQWPDDFLVKILL